MIVHINRLSLLILWMVFVLTVVVYGHQAIARTWTQYFLTFEDFVKYYSVEPGAEVMPPWEVIHGSDSEVLRETRIWWSDVTFCRPWGSDMAFRRVSEFKSGGQLVSPRPRRKTDWQWPERLLPTYDAQCYSKFEITIRPNDVEMVKTIRGPLYRINPNA